MDLHFVSRSDYRDPDKALKRYREKLGSPDGKWLIIPEGGSGHLGVEGASLIYPKIQGIASYTHLVCAVGTGTTLKGIDLALLPGQQALGIPVIAIPPEQRRDFQDTLGCSAQTQYDFDYSFGGYAKDSEDLKAFMASFLETQHVPLDFVYTARAAYALSDLIAKGYFPDGSRVLLLHTGGMQGNRSVR
jgi:1-aminocyclopropane-1-carboxylate deaminase/D-cysteine desulfhydrase-like pyridoxal-dependent ACC family enzyme